jgi:ketosteroid isomerase-like protein
MNRKAPVAPLPVFTAGLLAGVLAGVLGSGLVGCLGRSQAQEVNAAGALTTEEVVKKLKSELVQAYVKRDAQALDRIYAADYTVTDAQGNTRTKADELASLGQGEDRLESGRYDIVKVLDLGDVAVASGHGSLVWQTADGPRESKYYSFNVFVKRAGEWKYVAAFTP